MIRLPRCSVCNKKADAGASALFGVEPLRANFVNLRCRTSNHSFHRYKIAKMAKSLGQVKQHKQPTMVLRNCRPAPFRDRAASDAININTKGPSMTPGRIRSLRKSLGLSAEAFARAVGVTDGSLVRKWERGTVTPGGTATTLLEAAEAIPAVQKFLVRRSSLT